MLDLVFGQKKTPRKVVYNLLQRCSHNPEAQTYFLRENSRSNFVYVFQIDVIPLRSFHKVKYERTEGLEKSTSKHNDKALNDG